MNKILKKRTNNTCNLWIFIGVIIIIICTPVQVFGQSGDNESLNIQNVAFPSPTAASIKKFEDYPISYATGVPQISIPLYVASSRKLSIPISLSYHASGIRVEEVPGWVGSGWSLNAGGAIVRTVRGLPDEQTNGYLEEGYQAHNFNTSSGSNQYKSDVATGTVDAEPDDYSISAPGLSGKFTFKYDGTIVMLPHQNLKIEADLTSISNDIAKFTITKEDGTVYTFAEKEETYMVSINRSGGDFGYVPAKTYTSSWYLTKIESPYGDDEITLSYENSGVTTEHTVTISTNRTNNLYHPTCSVSENDNDIKNTNRTYNRFLKTITTSTEKIHFNRDDTFGLSSRTRLESILVETKNEASRLKKFVMDTDTVGNRLTLVSVKEYGITDSDGLPAYELDYYNTYTLPAFNSYAIDHWGYYNGETSNDTYIPAVYVTEESESLSGADRDPVFAYAVTGSLKKITLPTGGNTSFVYELNDYYKNVSAKKETGGGIRIKSVTTHDGISSANDVVRTYTYLSQNDASKSSGYLTGGPIELYEYTPIDGSNPCPYVVRNSKATGLIGGPPVAYTDVQEYLGTVSTNQGYSKYDLQYSLHNGRDDKTWKRGRVKEIEQFKSDDTIVQHQVNTYNFSANHVDTSYAVEVNVVWVNPTTGIDTSYSTKKIPFNSYTQYKSKQTNEVFDALGVNSFTTVEDYIYDYNSSDKILKLSELKQTNSDGSVRKKTFRYGYEENSGMKTANMLSQLYSVALADNSGNILSKSWSIWSESVAGNSNWNVKEQWQWEGSNTSDVTASEDPDSEAVLMNKVNAYDVYANPLEIEDNAGTKTAYDWSEDSTVPIAMFQNGDKDDIFAHSFALDGLDENIWTETDANNNVTTTWSIEDGKLKMSHPGNVASIWSTDYIKSSLIGEYSGRTAIEMDVKIGNNTDHSLVIGIGGSSYLGKNGGSENLVWASFKYGDWFNYNGSTWDTVSTNFITGQTYNLKIIADPGSKKVDYYVNGEVVASGLNGRVASSGVQVFSIGNYGRSSTATSWLIDNVRIYPEEAEAVSQEVDPLFRTPLAMKGVAGSTNRFTFDNFGRLNEVFNPNGERVSRNVYFYSLDGHTSFDDEDPNRVESITYNDPTDTTDKTISVGYLDGLGRPIQSQTRATDGTAIITGTLYDERSRPHITSRPIELDIDSYTNGFVNDLWGTGFDGDAGEALPTSSEIYQYYASGFSGTTDAKYAYVQTEFEYSPLGRVIGSSNAASALRLGQNQSVIEYGLNSGTEDFSGFTDEELSKTVSTDPNGNHSFSFTDGWGNTIASLVDMNGDSTKSGTDLITTFEYDMLNQLKKVTAPEGDTTTYNYNLLGQLIEKEMPDKDDTDEYRYDDRGNLRFTKHANHKAESQSESKNLSGSNSVTKTIVANTAGVLSFNFEWIDMYSGNYTITIRKVSNDSTIYTTTITTEVGSISTQYFDVEAGTYEFHGSGTASEILRGGYFSFNYERFTYTKYDDLSRPIETGEYMGNILFENANLNNATFPTSYERSDVKYFYGEDSVYSGAKNLKGRLSLAKYRDYNTDEWGRTWYSYNNQGLVEWIIQDLPGSGMGEKKIEYRYDELGRMTEMDYQAGESDEYYYRYSYDHLGRLSKTESRSSSGGSWVENAEYIYFADGQLKELNLGGSTQSVDYTYNSAGWLNYINSPAGFSESSGGFFDDRFGQSMTYDYAGNIDTLTWNQSQNSGQLTYYFSYDRANRLNTANQSSGNAWDVINEFNKNGVITDIKRWNQYGTLDNQYEIELVNNTNRIDNIIDWYILEQVYVDYDANGNMIENGLYPTKLESVRYDSRNLPYDLTTNGNTLFYSYDTEGQRVSKKFGSTTTSYIRGADGQTIAVYENDVVQFHNMLAGSDVIGTWDGTERRYFLKDHLGSVRTTVDQSGNVDGYDDYYPFGLEMPGRSSTSSGNDHDYRFTGHERDEDAGLTLDYMMARNYDPIIGRFLQIDPLADQFPGWSPYNYTFNNPLIHTDPDGKSPWRLVKMGLNIAKRSYKTYKKTGKLDVKAAAVDEVVSLVDNVKTLADGELNIDDAFAIIDLATGFGGEAKKAVQFAKNKKAGKAFEKKVGNTLDGPKAEQLTIEAPDGTRTKVDFAQNNNGNVSLIEAKGSSTAPLTKNQRAAHPQIHESGGTVRGNKGDVIGLPAGTKIPPTKVKVVRPKDIDN
jgi:RHS repeat-associated protein|tara:strand:- start:23560 stop:30108 length:6549 start_codon:yes stop_codon:yes gene_type:complete